MGCYGLLLVVIGGYGLLWVVMGGMGGYGWLWVVMGGYGWLWVVMGDTFLTPWVTFFFLMFLFKVPAGTVS